MKDQIKFIIEENRSIQKAILQSEETLLLIEESVSWLIETFRSGNKVLLCGNGGSAADAQHIAGELSGRFLKERAPLFAEALHVNSAALTAIANDYGYETAFARLLQSKGKPGDLLIGLSTSGNSPNVLEAMKAAQEMEIKTIGFTGKSGGQMKVHSDLMIQIPSDHTPRIQESHLLIGHIICELVEKALFD